MHDMQMHRACTCKHADIPTTICMFIPPSALLYVHATQMLMDKQEHPLAHTYTLGPELDFSLLYLSGYL